MRVCSVWMTANRRSSVRAVNRPLSSTMNASRGCQMLKRARMLS